MKMYRVVRTETITYSKEYTRDELIAMGVPSEVLTACDLTTDFANEVNGNYDLASALEEDSERYGDVQSSEFKISTVTHMGTD